MPAAYLENREGGGQRLGGRHFTQGGRPTIIGETFLRKFSSLEGAVRPEKPLEGLSGGTFRRWRAPEGALQLHFPCKTFAIGGRRTIAKGDFGAQGGHGPVPPAYAPVLCTCFPF